MRDANSGMQHGMRTTVPSRMRSKLPTTAFQTYMMCSFCAFDAATMCSSSLLKTTPRHCQRSTSLRNSLSSFRLASSCRAEPCFVTCVAMHSGTLNTGFCQTFGTFGLYQRSLNAQPKLLLVTAVPLLNVGACQALHTAGSQQALIPDGAVSNVKFCCITQHIKIRRDLQVLALFTCCLC